jgi:hypothetical protein
MSLTEQIIETIEDARARGASDQEIDRALCQIGCTRIVCRADIMIVYYDDQGVEQFIRICADNRAVSRSPRWNLIISNVLEGCFWPASLSACP